MVTTRPPKTIVKPTALGSVANTDTKLLIYGLFQKGRVLAQDGVDRPEAVKHGTSKPRNQRWIDFLRSTTRLPTFIEAATSDSLRTTSKIQGSTAHLQR